MRRACLAAASPPSPRSPRSRWCAGPGERRRLRGADLVPAPPTSRVVGQATLCLLNTSAPRTGWRPLAEDASSPAPPPRYSQPDGRAAVLRPQRARRQHAGASPDRGRLHRRRRRWVVGENIAWGQGDARDAALDGHRLDGEPRPPREHPQRRVHAGRPGPGPRQPRRPAWGATYTTDFGSAARRRRARAPPARPRGATSKARKKASARRRAPAASVRRGARSAKPRRVDLRPLGTRQPPLNIR